MIGNNVALVATKINQIKCNYLLNKILGYFDNRKIRFKTKTITKLQNKFLNMIQ